MTVPSTTFHSAEGEAFEVLHSSSADPKAPWSDQQNAILSDEELARATATISGWPGYEQTPLVSLVQLAAELNIKSLYYKDESSRFGLGSFKALGGAYAVARLLQREIASHNNESEPDIDALLASKHASVINSVTVCCATDGNHGRSVAWGAQRFGCQCVIFIHATVSEGRREAIARYGATVVRTEGNYDESVRQAQSQARENGWYVVSDTSYPGYVDVPKDVMQGYELMVAEADEQLPERPTHIFIQTGVGGVAAAVAGFYARRYGASRPAIFLADPDKAACWLESLRSDKPTAVPGELDTMMAGLACGEVSLLAWDILRQHADAVVAVPDSAVAPVMRALANPATGTAPIVAGESAVAGLIALSMAAGVREARETLCLTDDACVLVFGTEGDTDPDLFHELTGVTGDDVRQGSE